MAASGGCISLPALGADHDIGMSATAFEPATHTVSRGDRVVWKNTSSRAHTVTAYAEGIPEDAVYFASGGFDSETAARSAWEAAQRGNLHRGETYSHTFTVPGTYHYFCIPHERASMTGTITVDPD